MFSVVRTSFFLFCSLFFVCDFIIAPPVLNVNKFFDFFLFLHYFLFLICNLHYLYVFCFKYIELSDNLSSFLLPEYLCFRGQHLKTAAGMRTKIRVPAAAVCYFNYFPVLIKAGQGRKCCKSPESPPRNLRYGRR